ncbi:putative NRPS-like enzyme [Aspergillus alliaceus]|uniref:putative NRPS-like enzyme n=1 Tax=Petromyces alliaceus TaxID=209559 RepID=UPI0012A6EBAF|nr:putative nonribosomal peptide synthase [Aspergillus alliaceus]KAB8238270.1 putative nonribosomal peptide synthase [Aspergillus alliaceus]
MKLAPKLSQDGYVLIHKRIYKDNGVIWAIAEGSYVDAPHISDPTTRIPNLTTRTMNSSHSSEPLDGTVVDLFDQWAEKSPERVAAEWQGESLTYGALRDASLHVSRALLLAGVRPRARVPLLTQMSLDMLPAVIGILRVGACYVPMDVAAWSRTRIEAALSDLASPVAVITSPCPRLHLPVITVNFQREGLVSSPSDKDGLRVELEARRSGMRSEDLAWIIFTSGTTGKPKGVMTPRSKEVGACLRSPSPSMAVLQLSGRLLSKGATLVMASPSDFPEVATTCQSLNLTPSMLAALDPSSSYDRVRYIFLGAEAPKLEVVRLWITKSRKVFTTYGPSETTCVISFGELHPDQEVSFGELIPGVKVVLVNEEMKESNYGEVLISGPGLAAGYLNNPTLTAKKFIKWNGERFYRTGDLARRTEDGQLIWAGRADPLVKNRGFLINLETEVEPAMQAYPQVNLAVAFQWRDRLVGCVQPSTVDVEELRKFTQSRADPFVIPDMIFTMNSFPLNVNSKTDRLALQAQLDEKLGQDDDPDESASLLETDSLTAYDALRLAFSRCLQNRFRNMDRSSSFTRLGGNSLAAIQVSNFLKQRGYSILAAQVLKLDTIERLEDRLRSQSNFEVAEGGSSSLQATATPVQRLFLTRSLETPHTFAIIGLTKYIGDSSQTPTASDLRGAMEKTLSAHIIFSTRVSEDEFEQACEAAEEESWQAVSRTTRADNEVPYCAVTCISVPGRRALAFVTRIHHVLTDVFSSAILSQDLETALAGGEVAPGPRFEDFARFMHSYTQANIERATQCFTKMLEPLPASCVLQPPAPKEPPPPEALNLIRLQSSPSITRAALDASSRRLSVTPSTMIYAAWGLFLHRITSWTRVCFSVSLSGRTVPWPSAPSVVGPLLCRSLFSTSIGKDATVHDWLATVHETTLDIIEFDGLTHSLPPSLMADPRTNTSNVLCFLDVPEPSRNCSHKDRQRYYYTLSWYITQRGEHVATEFEVQLEKVDLYLGDGRGWSARGDLVRTDQRDGFYTCRGVNCR